MQGCGVHCSVPGSGTLFKFMFLGTGYDHSSYSRARDSIRISALHEKMLLAVQSFLSSNLLQ